MTRKLLNRLRFRLVTSEKICKIHHGFHRKISIFLNQAAFATFLFIQNISGECVSLVSPARKRSGIDS